VRVNIPDISDLSFSLFEQIGGSSFTDQATPEKSFINKITREKIHEAINELPEGFRTALLLCDVEDFSYAEIASITKVPVGTVRSRIARARNLLQQKLWIQACEMGIKVKQEEHGHVCTCGNEEIESLNITTS
jgi:RNA polymerase sigma factor (sigma-70 family)